MTSTSNSLVCTIQDLVAQFSQCSEKIILEEISAKLMQSYENLKDCTKIKEEQTLSTIHSLGIKLWNLIIAKKAKQICSKTICVQGHHVALHLTFIASFDDQSVTASRKQLAMALKTGREWLDINNIEMADKCFVVATECYMKLLKLIDVTTVTNQVHLSEEQLEECHLNMLRVYAFHAEVSLKQSQQSIAVQYFRKAFSIQKDTKKLTDFLYSISYNFGLDCYQKELFRHSIEWLCESVALVNNESDIPKETQATTYQLLAMAYLELKDEENLNKALQAIETSIQLQSHVKSNYLHLKISLLLDREEEVVLQVFNKICEHPQLDVDMALQYVGLLPSKRSLCEKALDIVNKRFPVFADNIKVQLKRLELMLSDKNVDGAKELIDIELIRINNHGTLFDKSSLKQLQLLLWEQAQVYYESGEHIKSLQWYNYSFEFMKQSTDDTVNMAKLQRNRSSCLIEIGNYEEALSAANIALAKDTSSPQTYFLLYKIYLEQNEDVKAIEAIDKISEANLQSDDSETIHGLICLASQLAFEHGNRKVSESALEKVICHVKGTKQTLVALRCLARLKFTYLSSEQQKLDDIKAVLSLIDKAYLHLQDTSQTCTVDSNTLVEEISWFNKIAWNLALSCKDFLNEMYQSFLLCYKLSLLLPVELIKLQQQKTCLLMAAGSSLGLIRQCKSYENETNRKLLDVLDLIKKCYVVYEQIKDMNINDPTQRFLLSYEFEVKARLGCNELDDLLEKGLELDKHKTTVFENFASVAFSLPNKQMQLIGLKSLKLSIKILLEDEDKDFELISKAIHNLINFSLQAGSSSSAAAKEDAYNCYTDALNVIEKIAENEYPEIELVWLMTKAWNCGIYLYSAKHHDAAEKWCVMAMKFLKFLKELKSNYESHMTTVFADIMTQIQQSRAHLQIEE